MITEWKFRQRTCVTSTLAERIVASLTDARWIDRIDTVTWAPTSTVHRRRRGYDQAELLARAVARQCRLRCQRLLVRSGATPQTGRSRSQRLSDGPHFTARPIFGSRRLPGFTGVLVVDDIVTTGSTLWAAERALRSAGYAEVLLAAVARTPDVLATAEPSETHQRDHQDR